MDKWVVFCLEGIAEDLTLQKRSDFDALGYKLNEDVVKQEMEGVRVLVFNDILNDFI
jgi:hypothetical protein